MNNLSCLPTDAQQACLIGRVWLPSKGPYVCLVTQDATFDLSPIALTSADLLALSNPVTEIRKHRANLKVIGNTQELLSNSVWNQQNASKPYFLAPCDLQPIKAAGVTFVASMLERVIEEQARGDASRAQEVRSKIAAIVGENLRTVVPGSDKAMQVKATLLEMGLWSQYLEVGIGPDAEVFTKSQAMSAVGWGAQVGIHPISSWNNPEPEVVLAVSPMVSCKVWHWATMSICATSKGAAHCCWARRKITMLLVRLVRSSGFLTSISIWMMCAKPRFN